MKYFKKALSVALCVMMLATSQAVPVMAQNTEDITAEETTKVQQENQASQELVQTQNVTQDQSQQTTQSGVGDETKANTVTTITPDETTAPAVNYLVVDQPYVELPGTQSILASVGDGTNAIESAVLHYQQVETGELFAAQAATIDRDELYFSMQFQDATQAGQYALKDITVTMQGKESVILLKENGIDASFGVNTTVETTPDAIVEEDTSDVDLDVVTIDENGNETAGTSIDAAIENAQRDTAVAATGATGDIVVVLDPGHDATHGGTSAGGLAEATLNLKIAKYCKTELETYKGVKVYLTRTTSACPHPGTTSGNDNAMRVDYAGSVHANVYVAIHNNMSPISSTSGAEVYYPNGNGNASVGAWGKTLAQQIQTQLVALGLKDRGIHIRNSESGDSYSPGALMDYYGVIRKAKNDYSIPGIIIEHAYQSSPSDVSNFLGSDAGLKKLGVADATGIANYFGLSKGTSIGATTMKYAKSYTNSIKVAWKEVTGATGYEIYRSTDNKSFSKIATVTGSNAVTYTDKKVTAATTYYYKVISYLIKDTGTIQSNECAPISGILLPAGTIQAVKSVGANTLKLTWTAIAGANGYRVYRADSMTGKYAYVGETTAVSYADKTAQTGVTYYYKVRAVQSVYKTTGYGVYSEVRAGSTVAAPAISSITSSSSSKLVLKWKKVAGATGYKIQRSTSKKGTYQTVTTIKSGSVITYTDTKLKKNKTYYYRIRSTNKVDKTSGYGDYGTVKSGWVTGAPTITKIQTVANGKLVLTWSKVEKATSYEIYRSTSEKGTYQKVGATTDAAALSYKDKAPKMNTKYYYKVRAIITNGKKISNGSDSKAVYGKALAKAEITKGYASSDKKIKLNWNAVGGANGYVLYRSTSTTGKYSKLTTITSGKTTSYTDQTVKAGKKYYYKIEATNKVNKVTGQSGKSAAYYARTVAKTAITSVVSKSAGNLQISWNNVSGENGYIVYRSTEPKSGYTKLVTLPTNTVTYRDKTATAGTTYYYKIKVTNKIGKVSGSSGYSAVVSGTSLVCPTLKLSVVNTGIKLKWKAVNQATGYYIQRSEMASGGYTTIKKITSGATTSYIDTTAANNKMIYYRIKAVNKDTSPDGSSGYSVVKNIENAMAIMGKSSATVAQMVKTYQASRKVYPTEFYTSKGAATIQDFCQIVLDEANAEGVRAEVVFAQICIETGYLQFGGQVSASQCNFCGLGALDGGAAGATFASVALGVRAQVQHLKGYATTDKLNQTCVDPRFSVLATRRGKAPYVEWLSIPNNPYTTYDAEGNITFGCGWASDAEYGPKLVTLIKKIVSY